jgi:hypothetical protein
MKIWFDTEFIEDGKTIDLISIGMIDQQGNTLYLENADCDFSKASDWVREHVLPQLTPTHTSKSICIQPRHVIRDEIVKFAGPNPEFWAYYASYDWVVLCQLFGRMIDLPSHWPQYCLDIVQMARMLNVTKEQLPADKADKHNALSDAIWCKEAYTYLMKVLLTGLRTF